MRYIKEIDGMRAVAVMAVVAFHAGVLQLPGGFVGVDVFFVISGYLITSLISSELAAEKFSLHDFYVRRILRIAPALVVAVMISALIFLLLTPPVVSAKLQGSVFAALFSYSNIWFYLTTDYFQNNSDSPLLHTWSLAVEEQFYLLLPLILMAGARWRVKTKSVLVVLALLSLVAAEFAVRTDRQAAFYLPWFRAWELLAGSLLAYVDLSLVPSSVKRVAGLTGLMLIGWAIKSFDEAMNFPGVSALVPVVGAVLLIGSAGAGGPVSWLLSCKPMRFMGKISYSVYLVHWPVVCLIATLTSLQPSIAKLGAILLSIFLGWLSWRFVEMRFRPMAGLVPRRNVFAGFSGGLLAVSLCFLVMQNSAAALWDRFPDALRYSEFLKSDLSFFSKGGCFLTPKSIKQHPTLSDRCLDLTENKGRVLIMGDSHAANLATGLRSQFSQEKNLLQATAVGCRPVVAGAGLVHCRQLVDYMLNVWIPAHGKQLDQVVLVARWEKSDLPHLAETVQLLRQYIPKVTVVGPWPEYFIQVPLMLAYEQVIDQSLQANLIKRERLQLDAEMALLLQGQASYVSAVRLFCSPTCAVVFNGAPLYFDRDHLSEAGVNFMLSRAML